MHHLRSLDRPRIRLPGDLTLVRRVADFPRPPAIEFVDLPIRIVLDGKAGAAAGQAWRILETFHPPTYYLPMSAFRTGALMPSARTSFCEWKGVARYYSIASEGRVESDCAWGYETPSPAYAALRDHIAVYAGRMEACFVGDERVTPQPGGFYGGWITRDFIGPYKGGLGTGFL